MVKPDLPRQSYSSFERGAEVSQTMSRMQTDIYQSGQTFSQNIAETQGTQCVRDLVLQIFQPQGLQMLLNWKYVQQRTYTGKNQKTQQSDGQN